MLRILLKFRDDQRGIAMILVAIMLPVIVGFALLVIDMSRANSLHNDLQKGADAMSLATAAELDGRADSIVRGDRALATLVFNDYRFGNKAAGDPPGATQLAAAGVTRRYLRSLPTNDSDPITSANVISDEFGEASAARYVEVTVTPVGFSTIFPASFVGGSNGFNIGSVSVAGFNRAICDTVPMFICNPFEGVTAGTGKSFQQAFADGDTYSKEFRILKVDSNPGPGNFGLLDNNLLSLRDAFAIGTSGQCYNREAIETKTGVTLGAVNAGLNVRFDLYSASLKQQDNNPLYRPAKNVRKGAGKTSNCNKFAVATDGSAMGFPPGDDYSNATGMTNSTWARSSYWSLNHGGAAMPAIPSASHPTNKTAPPSRYDVYKYELDPSHYSVPDKSPAPSKESGVPACYKGAAATLTDSPDRRLITMAVVNCRADQSKINGHTQLRPDAYVSAFLTNPVQKQDNSKDDEDPGANEKPISFEIVDVEGPFGNDTLDKLLRDEPELYR
ncbi:MAG: pilus assembly protein [Mesorhizobium sp.]|uniref:TadE/TadG family type IV pilus assembly protein n=1 Tax=Mesorhizobium sp. TaxID=1871066 RepID=UPI000FEA43BA|nr:TadE/TadG family type IV pilus assembly protein [Mesorhizobium sp.]RWP84904.1 MAG: pilus assembly protein [Mesorhizobium sp.]